MQILPLLLALTSCGYSLAQSKPHGGARTVYVETRDNVGIDVDAEAFVSRSVREAIARQPGMMLAESPSGEAVLEVRVVSTHGALAAFADPNAGAGRYVATVQITAKLTAADGKVVWRSSLISGDAAYISNPGGVAALDGARRRALEEAAREAADRLAAELISAP